MIADGMTCSIRLQWVIRTTQTLKTNSASLISSLAKMSKSSLRKLTYRLPADLRCHSISSGAGPWKCRCRRLLPQCHKVRCTMDQLKIKWVKCKGSKCSSPSRPNLNTNSSHLNRQLPLNLSNNARRNPCQRCLLRAKKMNRKSLLTPNCLVKISKLSFLRKWLWVLQSSPQGRRITGSRTPLIRKGDQLHLRCPIFQRWQEATSQAMGWFPLPRRDRKWHNSRCNQVPRPLDREQNKSSTLILGLAAILATTNNRWMRYNRNSLQNNKIRNRIAMLSNSNSILIRCSGIAILERREFFSIID